MESIPEPAQPRKQTNCIYLVEVQKIIGIHKKEYISQVSSPMWENIFRSKILPMIFNHWHDIGDMPQNDQASADYIKVLNFLQFFHINRNT